MNDDEKELLYKIDLAIRAISIKTTDEIVQDISDRLMEKDSNNFALIAVLQSELFHREKASKIFDLFTQNGEN
jgi:hypothetical protein